MQQQAGQGYLAVIKFLHLREYLYEEMSAVRVEVYPSWHSQTMERDEMKM